MCRVRSNNVSFSNSRTNRAAWYVSHGLTGDGAMFSEVSETLCCHVSPCGRTQVKPRHGLACMHRSRWTLQREQCLQARPCDTMAAPAQTYNSKNLFCGIRSKIQCTKFRRTMHFLRRACKNDGADIQNKDAIADFRNERKIMFDDENGSPLFF